MNKNLFIKRFSINHFKSIEHLDSSKFGKINIITGKNNSGKTTFLEALFLNLGPTNPTLWTNISARHGLAGISIKQNPVEYLFHNLDTLNPLKFHVTTRSHGDYSFTITLRESIMQDEINPVLEQQEKQSESSPLSIIQSEYSKVVEQTIIFDNGESRTTKTIIHPEGIFFKGDRDIIFPNSTFISPLQPATIESDVDRYDQANKQNLIGMFEELLRSIEPNLIRTSLGFQQKQSFIYVDVGYGLVPLSTLGSGVQRLATLILALTDAKDAIVLIDEVESSFHYSILDKVWKALITLSNTNNVQIFATTHSSDCIKSAYKISKEVKTNIIFHRITVSEGIHSLHTFSNEQAESLISEDWDLR